MTKEIKLSFHDYWLYVSIFDSFMYDFIHYLLLPFFVQESTVALHFAG